MTEAPSPAEKRMVQLDEHARESFAQHVIVERSEGRWLLKRPGTGIFWAEIVVLRGGYLLVHGDIECLVFGIYSDSRNPEQVVRWMGCRKRGDDSYLVEKASIGMRSQDVVYCYEPDQFRYEVEELRRDRIAELGTELADDEDEPSAEGSCSCCAEPEPCECSPEQKASFLRERETERVERGRKREEAVARDKYVKACDEALASYGWDEPREIRKLLYEVFEADYIPDGNVVSARVVFAHAALRRLVELLDAEEAEGESG